MLFYHRKNVVMFLKFLSWVLSSHAMQSILSLICLAYSHSFNWIMYADDYSKYIFIALFSFINLSPTYPTVLQIFPLRFPSDTWNSTNLQVKYYLSPKLSILFPMSMKSTLTKLLTWARILGFILDSSLSTTQLPTSQNHIQPPIKSYKFPSIYISNLFISFSHWHYPCLGHYCLLCRLL